jgi:hypothetical protein
MITLRSMGFAAPLCAILASPAAADPGRLMSTLVDADWEFSGAATSETPTTEAYDKVLISKDGVAIQIQNAGLSVYAALGVAPQITLTSPVITIGTGMPNTPVIVARDVSMTHKLEDIATSPCGMLDALDTARIREVSISFPDGTGFGVDRIMLDEINWVSEAKISCRMAGKISIGSSSIGAAEVGSATLTDTAVEIDLPVSAEGAKAAASPSKLGLYSKNLIASRPDRATVQTGKGLKLEAEFDGRTLAPFMALLGARPFFDRNWNDKAAFMDMWNVFTLLRADMAFSAESLQTMPPALIPTAVTSNFASVGLSTLTWGMKSSLRLRSGEVTTHLASIFVGIGVLEATIDAKSSIYSRDQLKAADKGDGELSAPDFRLSALTGSWRDMGFDDIFKGIAGHSIPSYFEKQALAARAAGDVEKYQAFADASRYFTEASNDMMLTFKLDDQSGVDLRDFGRNMVIDPAWLLSNMRIKSVDPTK